MKFLQLIPAERAKFNRSGILAFGGGIPGVVEADDVGDGGTVILVIIWIGKGITFVKLVGSLEDRIMFDLRKT